MSTDDKRGKAPPIPPNVKKLLTPDQTVALKRLEDFGWRIEFVRRPLFQQVTIVVTSYDGKEFGVLEANGELNMKPDIKLRGPKSKVSSAK